ncbi:baseplate hub domain-containing protein, partial [Elioraea sp.]|uniref:baseplate hub domain-containing protein n=1 Tax=Elioraea sp. TaxID=2185103 RepID=UPI003F6F3D75
MKGWLAGRRGPSGAHLIGLMAHGTVFGFTDHDADLVVDGVTYRARTGYRRAAIAALPRDREVIAYCRGPCCVLSFEAIDALRRR